MAARKRHAPSPPLPQLQLPRADARPWPPFLCDSKAPSALLVALLVVTTLGAIPSDTSRIAAAASSRGVLHMPPVRDYVPREETEAIVLAVAVEESFVIVEGGSRVGKTIAVKAAAVALSRSRAVLWYNCTEDSTMDAILRGLYALDHPLLVERLFSALQGAARLARRGWRAPACPAWCCKWAPWCQSPCWWWRWLSCWRWGSCAGC